jgi:hypothetical protein
MRLKWDRDCKSLRAHGDACYSFLWCMKMKLLRLVPVFVLLVMAVSLMPPTYATVNYNSSHSNTGNITCQGPSSHGFTAAYAITFTSSLNSGKPLSGQLADTCSFTGGKASIQLIPKLLKTSMPADGAIVNIQITVGSTPTSCSKTVSTQPNTPVTVDCNVPGFASTTVTVTTNVPESTGPGTS